MVVELEEKEDEGMMKVWDTKGVFKWAVFQRQCYATERDQSHGGYAQPTLKAEWQQ